VVSKSVEKLAFIFLEAVRTSDFRHLEFGNCIILKSPATFSLPTNFPIYQGTKEIMLIHSIPFHSRVTRSIYIYIYILYISVSFQSISLPKCSTASHQTKLSSISLSPFNLYSIWNILYSFHLPICIPIYI
jgi:hypothetical protein